MLDLLYTCKSGTSNSEYYQIANYMMPAQGQTSLELETFLTQILSQIQLRFSLYFPSAMSLLPMLKFTHNKKLQ